MAIKLNETQLRLLKVVGTEGTTKVYSNNITSHGGLVIEGYQKGGYDGIHLGPSANYMTVMSGDVHQGLYNQTNGRWIVYYNRSSDSIGLGTNSLVSNNIVTITGNAVIKNLLTVASGASHYGIKVGDTYINAINGDIIFQNNNSLRFGSDSWNWDEWAGLKYDCANKYIYLGIADKNIFNGNNVMSGGRILTPGISYFHVGNQTTYYMANDGSIKASSITVDNNNSSGSIQLVEDGEGGTIRLYSKSNTYCYEIDAYNDETIRIHTAHKNPNGTTKFISWNGKSGNVSADGTFYVQNTYPVMPMKSANGFYGIMLPDASDSNWIRTTGNGIIPYASGGSSALGTESWPFNKIYGKQIYGTLNGNASSATYAEYLTSGITFTPAESALAPADVKSLIGSGSQIRKGSWSYAGNGYIPSGSTATTQCPFGAIDLAGTTVIQSTTGTEYTQIYITPPTASTSGAIRGEMLYYIDQGTSYSPTWYRVLTDKNYSSYALPLAGGTMNSGAAIKFSATAGSVATSDPMSITYGRIAAYGTLCINANTDNSGTEYVILTAGKGLSSAIADGLAIGTSTLKWQNANVVYERDAAWDISINGGAKMLLTIADNPTTIDTDNTTSYFNKPGSRVYWYTTNGLVANQPSQWGYILDIGNGSERHQIWMAQAHGSLYHRGGNGSGWGGSWKTILDSSNYSTWVAAASHSHAYLPLTGGTLTGRLAISYAHTGGGMLQLMSTSNNEASIDYASGGTTYWVVGKGCGGTGNTTFAWWYNPGGGNVMTLTSAGVLSTAIVGASTRIYTGYDSGVTNSISCSNWFRSSGATGWYNATYDGGWYMSDTTWVRTHNSKGVYTGSGQIRSDRVDGGMWISGTHQATFVAGAATTAAAGNFYQGWYSGKTKNGAWGIGALAGYDDLYFVYGTTDNYNGGNNTVAKVQFGSGGQVYGAVWNDYAEYRTTAADIESGRVVIENNDDTLSLSTERLMPGANIVSDTFGFAIGETENAKTPLAVSGRVLAYPNEPRDSYHAGDAVCSGPNGTVSKMTREEIITYPERIIGTVSAVPDYETWGQNNVSVNGRIWIKV